MIPAPTEEGQFVTREEAKRMMADNGRRNASVWYNPVDKIIYLGEKQETVNGQIRAVPTFEEPIFDAGKFEQSKILANAGKLHDDEAQYRPWIGRWADIYNERLGLKSAAAAAGVHTNAQYATIDTTTVLATLEGQELRGFTIPEAVTTINTETLEYNIDVYTRFTISQQVPEGIAAWEKRGGIATISYDLTKDVGHAAFTFESLIKARQDLRGAAVNNIATDFRRSMSNTIAAVLVTATETNAADWDAVTSGLATNDPTADIQTQIDTIIAANGRADQIVSCGNVYRGFSTNGFVRGNMSPIKDPLALDAMRVSFGNVLPGVTWNIDNELLSTSCVILDKRAVVNVVGPSRLGTYVKEPEAVEGVVYRKWYQCQITQSSRIQEMTTVLS